MGNFQSQCRCVAIRRSACQDSREKSVAADVLEIDRPGAIYLPNDTISSTVLSHKNVNASTFSTDIIYFKKYKKNNLEKCQIQFFSTEYDLILTSNTKQYFKLRLDDHLPPSLNHVKTNPNISYSVNLIHKNSQDKIRCSIPIHVLPYVKLDLPTDTSREENNPEPEVIAKIFIVNANIVE
ncbi:unnamed protein product [Rotaria socialis]|uniref:Uncharacterized protein n=1 Tax=Rotaria socialis TaxID=392032 RepID=A0A821PWB7_9BILA|nr:unnamed protein product [Rotaria socialis]